MSDPKYTALNDTIKQQQAEIARQWGEIVEKTNDIARKDAEIGRLNRIIESQTRALDRWVERFVKLKAREAI
jgi:hypothetical protein